MKPAPLTPAEESVARMVADGLSNAAIAARRHCSVKAVENLVTLASRKIQTEGRPRVKLTRAFASVPRET